MSRSLQDQFIDDDEEETCPLCVEELDLQDRSFRPCPCGYQICQFCYHNVKTNLNGLCPACRRPYNDADVEYKNITAEETAAHKARQAQKQKKSQQQLQKEKQKAEADNLSRKHLAGMRVVQKNLVYVTGLSPTSQEDQLLQTLRGDQYFGQYGKIIKIVVSKAKDLSNPQSVGVYVTYERKEDAASCIAAVDGSKNGDRTLRAQFGTTKYCSAYLRGENCTNRNCMFLHEPGEANESYSRADLSALNAGSSHGNRMPPPQSQQPVSAAQPMTRQSSSDQPGSPPPDRPALPSTASWASKVPQASRAESRSTSVTLESPAPVSATPAPAPQPEPQQEPEPAAPEPQTPETVPAPVQDPLPKQQSKLDPLLSLLRGFKLEDFKLVWSATSLSQDDLNLINTYPPLFDNNGGARRRLRRQREEEQRRLEQEAQAFQQPPAVDQDENAEMSGSLQLGGEPEEPQRVSQVQSAIQPPGQDGALDQRFQFGGGVSSPGLSDRGISQQQQQHQQMLLQALKPSAPGAYLNNTNQSSNFQSSFQQQSNQPLGHQRNVSRYSFANDSSASTTVKPMANQKLMNQQSTMMPPAGGNHFGAQHQQPQGQFYTSNVQGPPPGLKTTGTPPVSGNLTFGQGHGFATGGLQYGAGTSRNQQDNYYRELLRGRDASAGGVDAKRELHSFPNYNNTHPNAAYQTSQSNAFPGPPYASLNAFGDGEKQRKKKGKKHRHANTSSSSGGGVVDVSADPNPNHLLQARLHQGAAGLGGGAFAGQTNAAGDDSEFPPLGPSRQHSITSRISLEESRRSTPPIPPGFEGQLANESRRSTPTVPPGLSRPTALPDLEGSSSRPTSRPSSRASLRRTVSQILPALPLRPGTPARPTPSRKGTQDEADIAIPEETPTKPSRAASSSHLKHDLSVQQDEETAEAKEPPSKENVAPAAVEEATKKIGEESEKKVENEEKAPASPTLTKSGPSGIQPASKGKATVQTTDASATPVTPSKAETPKSDSTKRKAPGKLDITAAISKQKEQQPAVTATPVESGTPGRPQRAPSQTPSMSKLPESPSIASPAIKSAPRTLRLMQTPKAETPSTKEFPLPTLPSVPPSAAAHKFPSRQPSVASINPPGTPSSEQVSMSDNISMTSTSQSRANSPPPASKVGSAPVRTKTKNQMKKERQERAKALEEEKAKTEEAVNPPVEEPAQEAIVSRKKKTKKEKEPKPPKPKTTTADNTPTASRPVSPGKPPVVEASVKPEAPISTPKESKPATPTRSTPTPQQGPSQAPPAAEPSPPPTPTLTAAQLINELKASAPEIQKCIDNLFRISNSHHFKQFPNVSHKDLLAGWKSDFNVKLTKEEVDALLTGKVPAVYRGGEGDRTFDRHMVTPNGAHLRALTKELESRFLELEKALREMPSEHRFRPSKPQNEMKFENFNLEELMRSYEKGNARGVSVMEQMVQDGSTMKKGAFLVDEASKYINEFVMPPATPPPSAGGQAQQQQARASGHHVQPQQGEGSAAPQQPQVPSVEIAERQLNEARRLADEKENALRKIIKKNKRMLGLS